MLFKLNFDLLISNLISGFLIFRSTFAPLNGPLMFISGLLMLDSNNFFGFVLDIFISGCFILILADGNLISTFPFICPDKFKLLLSISHNSGFIIFNLILSSISFEQISLRLILGSYSGFKLLFKLGILSFKSISGLFIWIPGILPEISPLILLLSVIFGSSQLPVKVIFGISTLGNIIFISPGVKSLLFFPFKIPDL